MDAADVEEMRDASSAIVALTRDGTLVWRVVLPSMKPLADFEVLVDAVGSEALRVEDMLRYDSGAAEIFDPNPIVANGGYTDRPRDRRDRDSALLTSLRTPVILERIEAGGECLKGDFVDARLGSGRRRVCRAGLDWTDVTRKQDTFEALMAYFHIDRTQAYIHSLGFTDVSNRRQVIVANAFPWDNAFFSLGSRRIELGSGEDDGEDADVIVHEYGHAIQHDQVRGFGRGLAAGSIGEGFGDYLAAAISAELSPGTSHEDNVCLFDWDGISWSRRKPPCGRRADVTKTIGQARRQPACREVHCLGEVWGSALYDLRLLLGEEGGMSVMDRVVIASNALLDAGTSFPAAAEALQQADEDLFPSGAAGDGVGAHFTEIHDEMVDRGFLNN